MPISRRDLIKKFKALEFSGPYSGGRHQFMSKGELKIRVLNPHKSGDISDSLQHEILRQAGITKEEWSKA
jgi:predicted RNA binding protein YcfA (HicA-like mRNA interferase family)